MRTEVRTGDEIQIAIPRQIPRANFPTNKDANKMVNKFVSMLIHPYANISFMNFL